MIKITTRNLFVLVSILLTTAISFGQVVSNGNDSGAGSLRDAVMTANANPGADIISITPLVINITLTSGTIDVTDELTIFGSGSTIDGSGNSERAFTVVGTGAETFEIVNLNFTNNTSPTDGGAIR
ncbi:MAG: hypothetical protein ACPGU0_01155, partial [Marinirhabdus sp.]